MGAFLFKKKKQSVGFRRRYDNPVGSGKYDVLLRPGYTALIGPDWCDKTKLLDQIRKAAAKDGWIVERIKDPIVKAGSADAALNRIERLAGTAAKTGRPLLVAMEYPEGHASVDLLMSFRERIDEILRDGGIQPGGMDDPVYIVVATNAYALCDCPCVDVRTGETLSFGTYQDFALRIVRDAPVKV